MCILESSTASSGARTQWGLSQTIAVQFRCLLRIVFAFIACSLIIVSRPSFLLGQSPSSSTAVEFVDVAKFAGVNFVHFKGNKGTSINLEEFGPGLCVSDYDGDGYQDIYFVNGRDRYDRGIVAANALYRNNGDGTFTDMTAHAGVPGTGYGMGCVWGDYDNDGFPDLFVSQYGRNVLYHNNGNGTFTDVTDKAGVAGMDFGTLFHSGAIFFDYDRDGLLDLYVGGYVDIGPGAPRYCQYYGVQTGCSPAVYEGTAAILYHNNGDGTFTNVTRKAGIYQPHGKNLAVGAADYDNDGWPDLFVANDGIDSYLYHNQRDGTFKEEGVFAGMAVTRRGGQMAAMCISLGDYNNDGWLDLYISDWQGSSDHVWKNDGKGFMDEVSDESGVTRATRSVLSFGGGFFDYDNDGWLDIFIANGHVYPEVDQAEIEPAQHYRQLPTLLHNEANGTFRDVTASAGSGLAVPRVSRGVAFVDWDNDGMIDIVVGNNGDAPFLLHNNGHTGNHFINLKLVGTKSNRDAIGARVRLQAAGLAQMREIQSGGSYLSQSDLRANFGLGKATRAESVEVSWPSGVHQVFKNVDADRFYRIEEGSDQLGLQKFIRKSSTEAPEKLKPPPLAATHGASAK